MPPLAPVTRARRARRRGRALMARLRPASRTTATRPRAISRPPWLDAKRVEDARRRRRPGARRRRRSSSGAAAGRSSRRQRARRTSRALARKPGARASPGGSPRRARRARAIACAAYSIAALASRPLALRSGWRGSRWLMAMHSIRVASHDVMRSSRHIAPRCGIERVDAGVVERGSASWLASCVRALDDGADEQDVRERRARAHRLARDREAELAQRAPATRRATGRRAAAALAARAA